MKVPKLRGRTPDLVKSYFDFLKDKPILEGRRLAVILNEVTYYCYMNKKGDMEYYKVEKKKGENNG